jgi:hypothetical protein
MLPEQVVGQRVEGGTMKQAALISRHDAKEGIIRAFPSGSRDLDSEMIQYAEQAIAGTVL